MKIELFSNDCLVPPPMSVKGSKNRRFEMDRLGKLNRAFMEVEAGVSLPKCQQCGCMTETISQIGKSLQTLSDDQALEFRSAISSWAQKMKPTRYSCLGCDHCHAGVAQNEFSEAFPETINLLGISCEIQTAATGWPPVVGDYIVLEPTAPVAVTTLASLGLSNQIADLKIPGLAIVGKLETENIGIDKLIKNTIANPNLQFLIVAGVEPKGHFTGQTLLSLAQNGVNASGRVIGSLGKHPILRNVSAGEVEAFRNQVLVVDLIGCENTDCIRDKITELFDQAADLPLEVSSSCGCTDGSCQGSSPLRDFVPTILLDEPDQPVKLDRAGYFVILPLPAQGAIHVEHYNYDNMLLHSIDGTNSRSMYLKIIEHGWVTEMSHAAYLGKELAKAEMSLAYGIPYDQDAA